MLTDQHQLMLSLFGQLLMRVVDQYRILEIQPPGAGIKIVACNELPLIVNPHSFQVIAVFTVFP